jgi:6-phospho-3-hexuloisomerase
MAKTVQNVVHAYLDSIKLLLEGIEKNTSDQFIDLVLGANSVFITGQGRSGLLAGCLATRLAQMGLNVHIPGQPTCAKIETGDVLIAFSCRGTTRTTIEYSKISKKEGAKIIGITASADSLLSKLADLLILIPSDNKAIKKNCKFVVGPQNNALFEQAAFIYTDSLIYFMLERQGLTQSSLYQRHTNLE